MLQGNSDVEAELARASQPSLRGLTARAGLRPQASKSLAHALLCEHPGERLDRSVGKADEWTFSMSVAHLDQPRVGRPSARDIPGAAESGGDIVQGMRGVRVVAGEPLDCRALPRRLAYAVGLESLDPKLRPPLLFWGGALGPLLSVVLQVVFQRNPDLAHAGHTDRLLN